MSSEELTINTRNWQYASEINKLIYAVNERRIAVGLDSIPSVVAKQTNIQLASFWNNISTSLYECSINPRIYSHVRTPRLYQLEKNENLTEYIKTHIPQLIRYIEVMSTVDIDGANIYVPYLSTEEEKGSNYPEKIFASGTFETPYLEGNILLQKTGAMVDDYLIINGVKLNEARLTYYIDSFNGVLGERKYNDLYINSYSARQTVEWDLVDTLRGMYRAGASISFAPKYRYYRYEGEGRTIV